MKRGRKQLPQMRLQVAYKTRVEEFVRLLRKRKGVEYARLNSHVGTRISRAAASLNLTNDGMPTKHLKALTDQEAAIMLMNESTRLRVLYEKINHEKTVELNEGIFAKQPCVTAKSKAEKAFDELKSKCKTNEWIRFRGGLKQLAEKHGTSAEELKRVGQILTNGMRGEHSRIFIPNENNKSVFVKETKDIMTVESCIEFLKSKGYKVMKPVSEWVEI